MSKYISEIIKDIKQNPQTWKRHGDDGLEKGHIIIHQCGNGHMLYLCWFTSIVEVTINGKNTWGKLTWLDKIRMEETFLWWIKNASVAMMAA